MSERGPGGPAVTLLSSERGLPDGPRLLRLDSAPIDPLPLVGELAGLLGCVPVQGPQGFELVSGWGQVLRVWRSAEVPAGWSVRHMEVGELVAHVRAQPIGRIVVAVPAVGGLAVVVADERVGAGR